MSKPTILLFLAVLGASAALICKQCNVDCDDSVDESCLEPGDYQETACLTETFQDGNNRTLYQRKCVLYEKGTEFECANYPGYKSISCVTCKTDRCNGVKGVTYGRGNGKVNATLTENTTETNNVIF